MNLKEQIMKLQKLRNNQQQNVRSKDLWEQSLKFKKRNKMNQKAIYKIKYLLLIQEIII